MKKDIRIESGIRSVPLGKSRDYTGEVFGCVRVLRYVGKNEESMTYWKCECLECGKISYRERCNIDGSFPTSCQCRKRRPSKIVKEERYALVVLNTPKTPDSVQVKIDKRLICVAKGVAWYHDKYRSRRGTAVSSTGKQLSRAIWEHHYKVKLSSKTWIRFKNKDSLDCRLKNLIEHQIS
jgi:hypothetical protein